MAISRVLRKGSSGSDVKELQSILINWGYSVGPKGADGQFGANTEAAVKAFQRDAGLSQDGILGQQTMEVMSRAGANISTSPSLPIPSINMPKIPSNGGYSPAVPATEMSIFGNIDWTMIGIIAAVVIGVVYFASTGDSSTKTGSRRRRAR